mgnify:CR=1 FL=1
MLFSATKVIISIHAPSRERLFMVPKPGLAFIFQSTLPRGSDHVVPVLVLIGLHFNPRSLAEATSGALCLAEIMDISIHAPSRERRKHGNSISQLQQFQSTLPHGSDRHLRAGGLGQNDFNPRSLTGATIERDQYVRRLITFQSTLPHGSDFTHGQELQALLVFQSTLPHGSDSCFFSADSI